MKKTLRILILEDSPDDVALIERKLSKDGMDFTSLIVGEKESYARALREFRPNVVLSDHTLPSFNSVEALELFQEHKRKTELPMAFILVTGTVSEEFAVEIMKKGADDYLLKDRLKRLPSAIKTALSRNELQAEKRRNEAEKLQLLEMLEKSLHELFIFNNTDLLFEYANKAALENLGYRLEEIQELTLSAVIQDFGNINLRSFLDAIEKNGKARIYESHAVRKDGSKYPVQIHLELVKNREQSLFMANVLDLTAREEMEKQKELALFIQNTFGENPSLADGLKIILQGLCERFDLPAAGIFLRNFEESDFKQYAYFNVDSEPSPEYGMRMAKMALNKEAPLFVQNIHEEMLPNEKNKFQSAMAFPIRSDGEILAVLVIYSTTVQKSEKEFFNIDEFFHLQLANNIKRKKTEEELAKIFDLSPEIISVASLDGHFKKVNPAFSRILGFSKKELLSIPFINLLHPDDYETIARWEESMQNETKITYLTNRYRTKNGSYKWISWSVMQLEDEELAFAVGKDITKEKKHLESIEQQNKKLSEIAWEQSHVVRGPLTRMMSCLNHLEQTEEYSTEMVDCIKNSAYELDKIIRTIVDKAEAIKTE